MYMQCSFFKSKYNEENANQIYFHHTEMTVNRYNYFCPFSTSISQYL